MKMLKIGVLALGLGCAGCAGTTPATTAVGNDVASAEIALTTAERLALNYTKLPACVPPAVTLCSDPAVKAQIKALDMKAYTAVMAARGNEALLGAALAAIADFTAAVPK